MSAQVEPGCIRAWLQPCRQEVWSHEHGPLGLGGESPQRLEPPWVTWAGLGMTKVVRWSFYILARRVGEFEPQRGALSQPRPAAWVDKPILQSGTEALKGRS